MPQRPRLILLAHGSRTPETGAEMRKLGAKIQSKRKAIAVSYAFLTLLKPTLADAVEAAVSAGSTQINVLPLFLFSGKHVLEDIPSELRRLRSEHRGVSIKLHQAVGRHIRFADFLMEAAGM